ncbi:MAG TPA: hypothetical protein VFU16_09010 [Solirubrobacterales bacterium]|nr:hypothetical protein [Solirubrobacterales bacterium]
MRIIALSIALLALAAAVADASPEPPPPGTPPSLNGLAITNTVLLAPNAPKPRGSKLPRQTTFSFFLNQNATVRVLFKQVTEGGRLVQRGSLTLDGVTGKNRIHFAGKTPKPKGGVQFLSPGRYRAFFKARNEFGASPESSIGFRLVRPKG